MQQSDNNKNVFLSSTLYKYPYLGYSPNLIEYFCIIGYDENFIKSCLLPKTGIEPTAQYPPTILSSISSDKDFDIIDNDQIIQQVFPNIPTLISSINVQPEPRSVIFSFCYDSYKGDKKLSYVCYSFVFYEFLRQFGYYAPKAFSIISQYPFFTAFKRLCETIYNSIENKKFNIPIELLIFNLVNFIPSPIKSNLQIELFPNANIITINRLTGYPYIDFDLYEMINYFGISFYLEIYVVSLLERKMLFFSSNLEHLNLLMYTILILNYPCNDCNFFWHIVTVSKHVLENSQGENAFVENIFENVLGVNCSYSEEINVDTFGERRFIVDLDKKSIIFSHNQTNNQITLDESKKVQKLFMYFKDILKRKNVQSKYLKELINSLQKDIDNLFMQFAKENSNNNNKNKVSNSFFEWNEEIHERNKKIQECFYCFYLNLLKMFYEENNLLTSYDNQRMGGNNSNNNGKNNVNDINQFQDDENDKQLFITGHTETKRTETFTKNEKMFYENFKESLKFKIFFDNFIQEYKCFDVYKVPLIFTEVYLTIKKKDRQNIRDKSFNYLELIDCLYYESPKNNETLKLTFNNFADYFKDNLSEWNKLTKLGKLFTFNKRLIQLYLNHLNNLNDKDTTLTLLFPSYQIKITNTFDSVTKDTIIELIENKFITLNILNNFTLLNFSAIYICSILISLYTQSNLLSYMSQIKCFLEDNEFFNRKYIHVIISSLYQHMILALNDPNKMKDPSIYIYPTYTLLNLLRSIGILPDKEMMILLKEILNYGDTLKNKEYASNDNGSNLIFENAKEFEIFITYCFDYNGTISEETIVNTYKDSTLEEKVSINVNEKDKMYPKIMAKILKAKHISYLYTPRTLFKKARELFKKFIHSEDLNYEDNLGEIKDVLVNLIFYDKYMLVPLKDEKEKGNNKKNATLNEDSMICYLLNKAYLQDIMIKLLNMDVIKKEKEKKKVQKQYNGDN